MLAPTFYFTSPLFFTLISRYTIHIHFDTVLHITLYSLHLTHYITHYFSHITLHITFVLTYMFPLLGDSVLCCVGEIVLPFWCYLVIVLLIFWFESGVVMLQQSVLFLVITFSYGYISMASYL